MAREFTISGGYTVIKDNGETEKVFYENVRVIEASAYNELLKEVKAWRQRPSQYAWLYELDLNTAGPPINCWVVDQRLFQSLEKKYDELMEQANKLSEEFGHLQKAVHERGGDCDDKTGCCLECKYAAQALADFEKWKAEK